MIELGLDCRSSSSLDGRRGRSRFDARSPAISPTSWPDRRGGWASPSRAGSVESSASLRPDFLLHGPARGRGLLRVDAAERLLVDHAAGRTDHGQRPGPAHARALAATARAHALRELRAGNAPVTQRSRFVLGDVMKVAHVHRMRGIGGSERHLLTPCLHRRSRRDRGRCSSGSTIPTRIRALLPPARRAEHPAPRTALSRSEAARLLRQALRRPQLLTSCTRIFVHADVRGARRSRAGRVDETQRRRVPRRLVPLPRARHHSPCHPRDRGHAGARALHDRACRPPGGEDRRRSAWARSAGGTLGSEPNPGSSSWRARVVLAVARLVE